MTHDIAIIVSTYERPLHLTRCLESIAAQQGVEGRFEVVVTDDGSRDETLRVVAAAARQAEFPLAFTTHDHQGFRLARCRNEGVAASTAPYLLFTDGDCLLPPDHVRIHLDKRREGYVNAGDCLRLDESTSERIDLAAIGDGSFTALMPAAELRRIRWKARRGKAYEWLRMPMRPRLSGNNIAIWNGSTDSTNSSWAGDSRIGISSNASNRSACERDPFSATPPRCTSGILWPRASLATAPKPRTSDISDGATGPASAGMAS